MPGPSDAELPRASEEILGFPPAERRTREQTAASTLLSDDAVELLQTHPRYAARGFLWILSPLVVIGLIWSALSHVDVVVVADAVLVAEGDVLKVRSPMPGVIREVRVRDGWSVKKGDVLFELRSREAAREVADIDRTRQAHEIAKEDLEKHLPRKREIAEQRTTSMRKRLEVLETLEGRNKEVGVRAQAEMDASIKAKEAEAAARKARVPDLDAEVKLRESQVARHRVQLAKTEKMLLDGLTNDDAANVVRERHDEALIGLRRAQRERTTQENDARAAELEVMRLRNSTALRLAELEKENVLNASQIGALRAEILELDANLEAEKNALTSRFRVAALEADKAKMVSFQGVAADRVAICAEMDGLITQVLVRQPGELVAAGDLVITLRPRGARLVAQAKVLNKDIGAVEVGQRVKIKYDAFPFMEYGIKGGGIIRVASDATPDPVHGPVYLVTVLPDEETIAGQHGRLGLSFGLKATVEVVTEQRTVVSFLVRPFLELGEGAGSVPK